MTLDLARDIPPFVMYCVYGESSSSLLKLYDRVRSVDFISRDERDSP